MRAITSRTGNPRFLRGFHGWMTVGWGLAIPLSLLTSLKTSLIWISLISVWANFATHWGAWQGSRAETAVVDATTGDEDLAIKAIPVDDEKG